MNLLSRTHVTVRDMDDHLLVVVFDKQKVRASECARGLCNHAALLRNVAMSRQVSWFVVLIEVHL